MKQLTLKRLRIAVMCSLVALAGCSPNPVLKVSSRVLNFGLDLPAYMTQVNLVGTVGFDEAFVGKYHRATQGLMYLHGVEVGKPEYGYRAVHVELRFLEGGFRWEDGEFGYRKVAMVPDHLPMLKAGDKVEIRQSGTFDTVVDFAKLGQGNAILRVLCKKSDPGYTACEDALPKTGKYKGQGKTGTPYLTSLKEYGYTFTQAYSQKGERLREFQ